MKYLLIFSFLACSFFCNAQNQNESAQKLYDAGLAISKENPAKGFPYLLNATKIAADGSDLQLKAIYKIAYYYNYAEKKIQPEVLKWEFRAVHHLLKKNRVDTLAADLFFRAGIAYLVNYHPDSALMCFSQARKRYVGFYGEESEQISDCYHLMGDVYLENLADYSTAEKYFEKALAIREKKENDELNLFLVGRLYSNLSKVNRSQNDFEKASAYALKNITYAESLYYPKKSRLYGRTLETAYSDLARIYRDMGFFSQAKNIFTKEILLNKEINTGPNARLAGHYSDIAETFLKEGLLDLAITNFEKAEHIYSSSLLLKEIAYISCLEKLGTVFLLKKEYDLAKRAFDKANHLINEYGVKKSGQAAELYRSVGDYYKVINKSDSALFFYQESLIAASSDFKSSSFRDNPRLKSIDLKDYAYKVLLQKAVLLQGLNKSVGNIEYLYEAMSCFSLAEMLLTVSRSELDSDDSKWNFIDSNYDLYEHAISMLYENSNKLPKDTLTQIIFNYMESSKSKMLTDALNEAEFSDPLMFQDSLVQLLNIQKRKLHQLNDKKGRSKPGDSIVQKEISNSMVEVDRIIQLTENRIDKKYPAYVKTKYKRQAPQLKSLQQFCKEERVSLIEYFWGEKNVYALCVKENEIVIKKIGSSDSLINILLPVLRFLNDEKITYSPQVISSFSNRSHELYQKFITPFNSLISESQRIIIIPDGPLGQLPFEVLVSSIDKQKEMNFKNLNYFIKDHILSYSFSSSYLLQKKKNKLVAPHILAFGFTGNEVMRSKGNLNKQNEIVGSETELLALKEKFPDGKYFFGKDVTEENFKEQAPGFDLIHLAVHGKGDPEQDYSASLFFRDKETSEDGELHWYELFGIRLSAKLAVISSCESGVGKNYKGEGMLSMAGAFAFAGCKNIVMGLWKVDDHVSVQLMDRFYYNLQNGQSVDEALTEAKRHYLDDADDLMSNPKIWASLAAYGNERIIEKDNYKTLFILVSTLAVSFLVFIFFLLKKRSSR